MLARIFEIGIRPLKGFLLAFLIFNWTSAVACLVRVQCIKRLRTTRLKRRMDVPETIIMKTNAIGEVDAIEDVYNYKSYGRTIYNVTGTTT